MGRQPCEDVEPNVPRRRAHLRGYPWATRGIQGASAATRAPQHEQRLQPNSVHPAGDNSADEDGRPNRQPPRFFCAQHGGIYASHCTCKCKLKPAIFVLNTYKLFIAATQAQLENSRRDCTLTPDARVCSEDALAVGVVPLRVEEMALPNRVDIARGWCLLQQVNGAFLSLHRRQSSFFVFHRRPRHDPLWPVRDAKHRPKR